MLPPSLPVKLRYVLWPFLRLWLFFNAGVGLGCAGLVWWRRPLQDPSVDTINFWPPLLLLAVGVVLIGLGSSFALIQETGRTRSLLPMLAVGVLTTAAGNLSAYVTARLAPACHLADLSALGRYAPARYYLAARAHPDSTAWRSQSGIYTTSGKHRHSVLYLAIACPAAAPTGGPAPTALAWVGFYYQHDTSATRVAATAASNQHFLAQSRRAFGRDVGRPCAYFERWPADRAGTAVRASIGDSSLVGGGAVVLRPMYTSFAERGRASLLWWVQTQAASLGLFSLMLLLAPLHKAHCR